MALSPVEDAFAGIATALYGDGAWELIKKDQSEKQRKALYRANMAGNTVATVGGAHALGMVNVLAEPGGGRCGIGVGGTCDAPADFPRSYHQAELALRIQAASGAGDRATTS